MPPELAIRTVVSAPFGENTYIAWVPPNREAVVIDPGMDPGMVIKCFEDEEVTPVAILNTHGHIDHIAGNGALRESYPDLAILIGAGDARMLNDPVANLSAMAGLSLSSPPATRLLREGDTIEYAGMRFEILDVPGHTPGHIVFIWHNDPPTVFGGDVLFREGIGRFDFPGSDGQLLLNGIRTKLFSLPDETVVYPGHGPVTTIAHEKRFNPFVGAGARFIPE
jgi:glyoxylase-like metal-dependent hydrolase (beta-lactamase superfamily II)